MTIVNWVYERGHNVDEGQMLEHEMGVEETNIFQSRFSFIFCC